MMGNVGQRLIEVPQLDRDSEVPRVLQTPRWFLLTQVVLPLGCTVEAMGYPGRAAVPVWLHAPSRSTCWSWASLYRQAVAIIITGRCLGGVIPNVIKYWIDGDMDLLWFGLLRPCPKWHPIPYIVH
uniref:Uncharacterized protein n=1 Tax=Oncorhynchus tshawytscha TaxID=74940 RepID=A0A8C8CAP2_ONCTS